VQTSIEAVRALLPLVEAQLGPDAQAIQEALSQLQLAYARGTAAGAQGDGEPSPEGAPDEAPDAAGGAGPAQSSGRLWVPGQ
jgi:hypothetical protein